ncbi:septal ring lytic transglycosylase RlpA family protein [Paucibacter sp. DJ1R-11]|uniref:septal ring lytic transglycosylase RlpA family protein n=1 Tax=Paucibacter sp. DJ1R-11 TaxID=2893556 RepID=UPI0021E46C14|nr:septal ring lytic transglycosylase RlpA family protein [Paucibacter sp. DJ1R-11]MCV2362781.1 septal ring lytic transglycosylase RlpA family protein [Paucibacter sp. DJ1R-11]
MSIRPSAPTRPSALLHLLAACCLASLFGCASGPSGTSEPKPRATPTPSSIERDGPEAIIPPGLAQVPDATPKLEPVRKGGPNKPYEVFGQRYEPMTEDLPLVERGLASWYGKKFHGKPTSSGEIYNMYAMTGAHATIPIPGYARVRNPANGREVLVRINDRGPFHRGRIIDLSYTAALKLDILRGVSPVEVERITFEDIRSGAWQRQRSPETPVLPDQEPVYAATGAAGAATQETTQQIAQASLPAAEAPLPPAPKAAARGFWVQLGAFSRLDGAEAMRRDLLAELGWLAPLLAVFKDSGLHRLQAGPYASREDARRTAEQLRTARDLKALVVERR